MALDNTIRWLHLSDFHIGKDGYGQSQLLKYILRHVDKKPKPDFVFITGDIAQSGQEKQYEEFGEKFIQPLKNSVGEQCKIFIIPGNHDVDRKKEEFVTRDVIRQKSPTFFDPNSEGQTKRQAILSRFMAYAEYDQLYLDNDENWLASSRAYFAYNLNVKGINIGILGLNTAWFAEDENDEGQLTPGKAIVESGLETIDKADIKIVLGHHPLDWFHPDDTQGIRALFGKHRIIYLHGHLHRNSSRFEEGAGHLFLQVQSGAAFQAREDDTWINGLLWGEWNQAEQRLELEPYCWSARYQEWSPDTQAFPNAYRIGDTTRFALTFGDIQTAIPTTNNTRQSAIEKHFKPPEGWDLLTQESLKKFNTNPDDAVILSYFDGRVPSFGLALCPKIPRRNVVKKMAARLDTTAKAGFPAINMILGAGGEGKTTAFLQIIEAVLQTNVRWRVVYRRGDGAGLSKKMVDDLPKDGNFLIASDDSDLIAEEVYRIAFTLQIEGRSNVHFLLSARHTDWRSTKITPPQWQCMPGYHEEELCGLDAEDAARVVDAWSAYHEKGLGRLAGLPREEAIKQLVEETRSEKSVDDGAFLGALLRLRFGEQLKAHVRKLLDRLHGRKILPESSATLLEAFAYIAAMHAENKLFLSKMVLSKVLGVHQRQLRSKVLWPLGEEAAADVAGEMVFTRHRAIAETAIDILSNTLYYEIDLTETYVELVKASRYLYLSGEFVSNLAEWKYLSTYFFEKNNTPLAIALAKAVVDTDVTDSYGRVKLAQLFRKAGQPEQALRVFWDAPHPDNHRSFFHEWAAGEGLEGNFALSVWLDAVALADEAAQGPPDNRTTAMCLHGFALASERLFEGFNKTTFIQGCGAAAQLGLALRNLTSKDQKLLSINQKSAHAHGVTEVQIDTALKRIQDGAIAAYQQRETDLPEWIPRAEELTFHGLAQLLGIESNITR